MYRILGVLVAFALVLVQVAVARDVREFKFEEKIVQSDAIFLGTTLSHEKPEHSGGGLSEFVNVKVDRTLKGDLPNNIRFVTVGFSEELDPSCCEIGKEYLFFAKNGYDIFVVENGEANVARSARDEFFSGVNGPFSTYLIEQSSAVGWNYGATSLNEVAKRIEDAVDSCK